MDSYDQTAIAFILNVNNIAIIKKELIEFIKQVETDDRLYLYNESGLCFDQKSHAVAHLASYSSKLSMQDLIKDAIAALNYEDFSCGLIHKNIFIISDNVDVDSYSIKKMLNRCALEKCAVHIFETAKYFETSHKLETFDGLGNVLSKLYREII
jgi:hypothetical protein